MRRPERIDLARVHCQRLKLTFHVRLPADVGVALVKATHHHDQSAYFGTLYRVDGVSYEAEGSLRAVGDEYHIDITLAPEYRGKPPRDYRSVGFLFKEILRNAPSGPIKVNVEATFGYDKSSGKQSLMHLPTKVPLMKQNLLFTHIEAIRLGQRQSGRLKRWVEIASAKNGATRHLLGIELERMLTNDLCHESMKEASQLSLTLMKTKGKVADEQ